MSTIHSHAWLHLAKVGMQYYITGRAAARGHLVPVAGNLLHHAVEMILKADLSRTLPLEEIKKKYGHRLVKTWDAFKNLHASDNLAGFDQLIADLDRFETIRYPDEYLESGAVMSVASGPEAAVGQMVESKLPEYCLYVNEVDILVTRLSKVCCINLVALCGLPNPEVERSLRYQNSECEGWGLPPLRAQTGVTAELWELSARRSVRGGHPLPGRRAGRGRRRAATVGVGQAHELPVAGDALCIAFNAQGVTIDCGAGRRSVGLRSTRQADRRTIATIAGATARETSTIRPRGTVR